MPGGHKASLPLPTDHYSPTPEGGNAYKVGDDHDPEGLFGVVRPLLKAGGASVIPADLALVVTTEPDKTDPSRCVQTSCSSWAARARTARSPTRRMPTTRDGRC